MRKFRPSQKPSAWQQEVGPVVIPVPTGGWDAISPLAAMEPQYAPILDNWVPRTGFVEMRPGFTAWAQGISSDAIETLMAYRPANSTQQLFAAASSVIYDVTDVGATSVALSGLSNARWQTTNVSPGGSDITYLYIVNGADSPRLYDGTSWTTPTITGGPTPSTFINIGMHKRRVWFVEDNSTTAWYLATDAISGALAGSLDIGPLLTKGGNLIATATISLGGGYSPDDLVCFVSSRGQMVVYKGTDPTSATAWSLVSVLDLPPPIGNRCFMPLGADLAYISLQGVIPVSQAFPVDTAAVGSIALTKRIQNAMLNSARMGQFLFGWQMIHYPAQGLAFLNVPVEQGVTQVQYVQNMLTGAWFRITGWNANCWEIFNDDLYFGDNDGNVNLAWSGPADLVSAINADMQCAFNYFENPGRLKNMTMLLAQMISSGDLIPGIGVDVDFGNNTAVAPAISITPSGAQWDVGDWDVDSWSAGLVTLTNWQAVEGQGLALAVRMKVNLLETGAGGDSVFDTGVFDTAVFDGFGADIPTLQVNAFTGLVRLGSNV